MAAPPRGPGALHSLPGSLARAGHCGTARSSHLAALVLDPVERACGLRIESPPWRCPSPCWRPPAPGARSRPRRARENLEKVGLLDKADQYPSRLSGGQQQRVAIARALAMNPDVMLFDEITSSLDPELVGEVLNVMRDLSAEGMTMIVVTHELGFAYHLARQVLFLYDGVIHEQGTPDEVLKNPQQERTQGFLAGFTDFYF